jgi:hypothetical protein
MERIGFRTWMERAMMMDPWEAMEVLGLDGKANQTLSSEELAAAYRPIAAANHPDRNPDPEAVKTFKRATEAYEVLQGYVDQTLPAGPGMPGYGQTQRQGTPKGDWYGRFDARLAPLGRYTAQQFEEWADKVVELNYFQAVVRHKVGHISWGSDLVSDSSAPLGSKERTFRVVGYSKRGGMQESPRDKIMKFVRESMASEGADFPANIVDLKINERWKSAWVTYAFPSEGLGGWSARWRSISFDEVKKKEPKKTGVGMKVEEIVSYLRSNGLEVVAGGSKNSYYGPAGERETTGFFIKIAGKTMKVVKRVRHARSIDDVTLTRKAYYFGEMTMELLDKWIAFLKKKREEGSAKQEG